MNIKRIIFLLLSIFIINRSFCEEIIFDLGGVLLKTNKIAAFKKIGFFSVLGHKSPSNLLFDFLNDLDNKKPSDTKAPNGKNLPKIFCSLLSGQKSSEETLKILKSKVEELAEKGYFKNKSEKKLLLKLIDLTFNPENLASITKPSKKGIKLVKKCANQVDSKGNKKHKLYILSNWDYESFEILLAKYPALFSMFDGIVISGNIKLLKPDKKMYKYILETYNLNPKNCIFVDDQKENIDSAKKLGITGIHCTSIKNTYKILKEKRII